VTAPHEPALELIETGVRERAGTALIGSAGVGKTWLARTAADRLASQFGRVDWVTATAPAVPFSAFSYLMDVPSTGKTAAVLRDARESLGDGRLLVVDDAHLLDKLSAALVYQLAVSGTAKLIVTVSANGPVADEISALWRDHLLTRIDIQPPGHDDSRLATLVEEFVAALPGPAHRVLEYLAVGDPLALDDVSALADRATVTDAEAAGAIIIDGDRIRPAHPLFVDAVRDALGGPELRRLRTELVDRLAASSRGGVVDRLRLAVLSLDSDSPQPEADLAAAAAESLRLGDLELVGAAARGQPVLDAERTGAGDRIPAGDAWQGVFTRRPNHAGRAVGDVRDERR
jgi:hypothetical protein